MARGGLPNEEMREFEEALRRLSNTGNEAADAQEDLAEAADRRTGGGDAGVGASGEGGAGFSSEASGLRQAFGGVAGAVGGFAGNVLSNAAGQFGQGVGAGDALESSLLVTAKEYIQSNPEFSAGAFGFEVGGQIPGAQLLAASGVAQAFNNAEQAGARVGNRLAVLAEQGVEIPDDVRERLLEVETERVARGNEERAKVNAAAISIENISSQVSGEMAQKVIELLERISTNLEFPGGGN